MAYSVEYFHAKVQATIEAGPVDVVADYARIVELLIEHGPNLRLPHSRAFGGGLFELRARKIWHWKSVLLFSCWATCGGTARVH